MSDVQVMQADRDFARDWNYECRHCSEYDGDFEADLAEAAALHRLATRPAPVGEPVGTTGEFPGSNGGFSMAVFEARNVPVGTPLYTRPALDVDGLVEKVARAIYEADDVWHVAFPWPNPDALGAAENYRRIATAALAAIKDATDAG